jgi:hypothetical protein
MRSHRTHVGLGVLCLALLSAGVPAAGPPASTAEGPGKRTRRLDALALALQIDRHLAAAYAKHKVTPAPLADDAEFVRRVYLDLAGRIPRVSEVRAFLDDRRPDKRMKLVDRLLSGPNYIAHLTNVWRDLLLPQNNNQQVRFLAGQIENWVRSRIRANTPYDKMIRELLTAEVATARTRMPQRPVDFNASAFYQANEMKPDNIAAATSRLFLGVKIECAQCHDHPFANWTRKQFWEYTAFFAGIKPQTVNGGVFTPAIDDPSIHEIAMPGTEKKVQARFLDGKTPKWTEGSGTRTILANWMTSGDNPFFARTAANRMWEHFMGIGLVDPVDDFRDENPASHPELLDELAQQFVANEFDLKYLIRAITASKTYQRSSRQTHLSQADPRSFGRMSLKGLTAEQIFDSLATATGYRENNPNAGQFGFRNFGSARGEFLTKFANPVDRRTEHQTSILQALALMNGKFIADATSLDKSETLGALLDSPFMDNRQRLDTLYLAALGRSMYPAEADRLIHYVSTGGPSRNPKRALADVFWVLLNSSEFILNH